MHILFLLSDYLKKNCLYFGTSNFSQLGVTFQKEAPERCAFLDFIGENYYSLTLDPGYFYHFSLWGASAGKTIYNEIYHTYEGNGSFTSGDIRVLKHTLIYLLIGGTGEASYITTPGAGGFNGGQKGGTDVCNGNTPTAGSGGSTDIRILPPNDKSSLYSRIMVAGAGGSGAVSTIRAGIGGNGGKINGENGTSSIVRLGGVGGNPKTQFGVGEIGGGGDEAGGSGGSGYFGGKGGQGNPCESPSTNGGGGGGGGSSYISGYPGCVTMDYNGVIRNNEIHSSGMVFKNGIMMSGSEMMPNPDGGLKKGNNGNGIAMIYQKMIISNRVTLKMIGGIQFLLSALVGLLLEAN